MHGKENVSLMGKRKKKEKETKRQRKIIDKENEGVTMRKRHSDLDTAFIFCYKPGSHL